MPATSWPGVRNGPAHPARTRSVGFRHVRRPAVPCNGCQPSGPFRTAATKNNLSRVALRRCRGPPARRRRGGHSSQPSPARRHCFSAHLPFHGRQEAHSGCASLTCATPCRAGALRPRQSSLVRPPHPKRMDFPMSFPRPGRPRPRFSCWASDAPDSCHRSNEPPRRTDRNAARKPSHPLMKTAAPVRTTPMALEGPGPTPARVP